MRAGLYARVSSEEQAEGYSLDAQLEAMRRFCRDRGWTVIREYTEEGYTGTKRDRPAFSEALAEAWQVAPVGLRAQMLKEIFAEIRIDLTGRRVVAVKPWPPFLPLFRMDGLEEKADGWFYPREAEARSAS